MAQHDFTPAIVKRLRELQSYFENLDSTDPDFNFYFVWIHNNIAAGESEVSDANFVLKATRLCDKPECAFHGSSYYHSDNWPQFPDFQAEIDSQNELTNIMDEFPLVEPSQWPDWAAAFGDGQDWDALAVLAAVVGIEFPSVGIPVEKLIVTARSIRPESRQHPALYGIFREEADEPIATVDYSAETKHGLDLLARTPVTLVRLYGLFAAAAKLAQATIAKWNKAK